MSSFRIGTMASSIMFILTVFSMHQFIFCFKSDSYGTFNNISKHNTFDDKQLIFVQVLYRHGDRNIVDAYPNDPYKNESFWPGGFGVLTNVGKQQQYELGKYIRRRYIHFIGERYAWDEVFIRSTDVNRTILSAQCNLAGMFSPIESKIWKCLQSIPIQTVPINNDYILYPIVPCLRRVFLVENYAAKMMEEHRALVDFLQMHSGLKKMNFHAVIHLHDTLFVEQLKGFTLPEWVDKAKGSLQYLATRFYEANSHSAELKKISTGFLIKDILDRFKNKTKSLLEPDRKMWIYSAHDMNIVNILNALNLYKPHIPSYASSVYFELYKRGTEYYVQLYYRNKNEEKLPPLEIPNCGTLCPLDEFYELYKDLLPNDSESHDLLCKL